MIIIESVIIKIMKKMQTIYLVWTPHVVLEKWYTLPLDY